MSGMVQRKLPLNEDEVKRHLSGEGVASIVFSAAIRSSFHPAGYGIWSEKIVEENEEYFATWTSSDSCD